MSLVAFRLDALHRCAQLSQLDEAVKHARGVLSTFRGYGALQDAHLQVSLLGLRFVEVSLSEDVEHRFTIYLILVDRVTWQLLDGIHGLIESNQ